MSPFPIALCRKNHTLAGGFVKLMDEGGDFQVVTVFNTTSQATSELPSLLSPSSETSPVRPVSGLGSNASSQGSTAPKAIIVGAGFSDNEVETMRRGISGVPGAEALAWFTPARTQSQRPGQPGFMEAVVGRAQEALGERRKDGGQIKPGVHGF